MSSGATITMAALLTFGSLTLHSNIGFAENKTAERIQTEFDREKTPGKRVKLGLDLTDEWLKRLTAAYTTEDELAGPSELRQYMASIDRLEKAVEEDWNKIGKNVEIRLRRQLTTLENHAMSASYLDKPALEEAIKRVSPLHARVLDHLMKPRKR